MTRRKLLGASAAAVAASVLPATGQEQPRRKLKALVYDIPDKWTGATGAAEQLAKAGFEVEKLPLDKDPYKLVADLIFLASFCSESPEYAAYMKEHAKGLYNFVDRGHVLVQMAQADQTEGAPPFLPSTHSTKRIDTDFASAMILKPKHPLMNGVPSDDGVIRFSRTDKRTIWETLVDQEGFEVIVAAEENAIHPALMEGAHGKGRMILCAMDLDKNKLAKTGGAYGSAAQHAIAAAFFTNLHAHTQAVIDGTAPAVEATPRPEPPPDFVPGSWTLAVMPDTQVYSLRYPGLFVAQAQWIIQNRKRLNIQYALQLGDITNNNTIREWQRAREALLPMYGQVPLALCTGNHDYGPNGDASTRDTHFNKYFPLDEAKTQPTFGGTMTPDSLENSYHLFTAGNVDWIIIALEWSPRDEVVAWANEVMNKHDKRRGILITHAYMNFNDLRYDRNDKEHTQQWNPHEYRTPGSKNDGEELWQKLVRKHDFAIVHNGHVLRDGTGYLASKTDKGRTCHQILANYQMRNLGGEAYTRLMEFRPDGKSVQVKTYSPLYDWYLLARDQQFAFALD